MTDFPVLSDIDIEGKRVLLRVDMNVPLRDGVITDDSRIRAHIPTIRRVLDMRPASVLLLSHLGRPTEGRADPALSLSPVAGRLSKLLGWHVVLWRCLDNPALPSVTIMMCENVRFHKGESADSDELARRLATLGSVYIMDAFGCAHRKHASVCGVVRHMEQACAGPLLEGEVAALQRVLQEPARPLLAIVGGAKTETKLGMLKALADKADDLIVGGALANTVLAAAGDNVGRSLVDREHIESMGFAKELLDKMSVEYLSDFVCARSPEDTDSVIRRRGEIADDEMILDLGPQSRERVSEMVGRAKTVLWNGPVGMFEKPEFSGGTEALGKAIKASSAYVVAGGGDTLAAINHFNLASGIGHISTGGGAFLDFIQNGDLPALAALRAGRAV